MNGPLNNSEKTILQKTDKFGKRMKKKMADDTGIMQIWEGILCYTCVCTTIFAVFLLVFQTKVLNNNKCIKWKSEES